MQLRRPLIATLHDVARLANVSVSTVSRHVRQVGYVSPEARVHIEEAVRRLGYRPNAIARSLRHQRSLTLALVVPEIENPFYTTVSRGIEDVANAAGYAVMYCNTDEQEEKQQRYLRALLERQVDGVFFVPCGRAALDHCRQLKAAKIPFVLIDREVSGIRAHTFVGDNGEGARQLTRHLLSLGHRHIGLIGGNPVDSVSRERRKGYRKALFEWGLAYEASLVRELDWSMEAGSQQAHQLLKLRCPPTALLCTNNVLAVGALRALREAGKRVPEDLALVCFDDIELAALLDPFLTVAIQPAYEMGRRAATLLIDQLGGQRPAKTVHEVLPVSIVIRRSCGGRLNGTVDLGSDGWIGRQWRTDIGLTGDPPRQ